MEPTLLALRPLLRLWPDVASIPADRHKLVPTPSDEQLSREGAFDVSQLLVTGPTDAPDLTVLVCRPTAPGAQACPLLYWMHPGGMIIGNARTHLDLALDLASAFDLVVISVDYRLAPEHPHPAPVEDCYAGLLWAVEHAQEHGADGDRVIVAGGSAGGGLAAAVALLARDRGGPALLAQMLLSPMLDDRNDTASSWQMTGRDIWDHDLNALGWAALLGRQAGSDSVPPYAAPMRATDLSGLPATYIDVGSAETFRDEAVHYAARLWRVGVDAELHVWPGGFHGFEGAVPHAALSRDAHAAKLRWLGRLLTRHGGPLVVDS
ncbi:MAG: hypothetical protein JWL79_3100 [Frankiales bacterium]|nr:hypothetical protein [Frankiales bacterium]